jgi:hypothetical protein
MPVKSSTSPVRWPTVSVLLLLTGAYAWPILVASAFQPQPLLIATALPAAAAVVVAGGYRIGAALAIAAGIGGIVLGLVGIALTSSTGELSVEGPVLILLSLVTLALVGISWGGSWRDRAQRQ